MSYELVIRHGDAGMRPPVAEDVSIEWERTGQPGKLTFDVIKTPALNVQEGDCCIFSVDGTVVFKGFVFEKSRKGSEPYVISVTAYDQLYYLKNKDSYVYENKTATEVVKMIAEDFELEVGKLEDTGYVIASRTEDNQTLTDIIQNALDETLKARGALYVLYDEAGRLTLKSIEHMLVDVFLDKETGGDFDYKTSIADRTYNTIKLEHENADTGERNGYTASDPDSVSRWGILQHYEKMNDATNIRALAEAMLKLYNTKTRTLKLQNMFGDIRVRPGSRLVVNLELGDTNLCSYLMVEQAKHTFRDGQHLMELRMRGGNFVT